MQRGETPPSVQGPLRDWLLLAQVLGLEGVSPTPPSTSLE